MICGRICRRVSHSRSPRLYVFNKPQPKQSHVTCRSTTTASEDTQVMATFPFWKRLSSFQIFSKLRRNSSPPGSTRSASYSPVSCGTKPIFVPYFHTPASLSALLIFDPGFPTRTMAPEPPPWSCWQRLDAFFTSRDRLVAKRSGSKRCAG